MYLGITFELHRKPWTFQQCLSTNFYFQRLLLKLYSFNFVHVNSYLCLSDRFLWKNLKIFYFCQVTPDIFKSCPYHAKVLLAHYMLDFSLIDMDLPH